MRRKESSWTGPGTLAEWRMSAIVEALGRARPGPAARRGLAVALMAMAGTHRHEPDA